MTKHERALYNKRQLLINGLNARDWLDGATPEHIADVMLACGRERDRAELVERLAALQAAVGELDSLPWEKRAMLERIQEGLTDEQAQRVFPLMLRIFGDERSQEELQQIPCGELIEAIISRSDASAQTMREQMEEAMAGTELPPDWLEPMEQTDPFLVAVLLDWAQDEGDVQLGVPPELFAAGAAALRETARLTGKVQAGREWLSVFCSLAVVAAVALLSVSAVAAIFPTAPVTELLMTVFTDQQTVFLVFNTVMLSCALGACAAEMLINWNETRMDAGLYQAYNRLQSLRSQSAQTAQTAAKAPFYSEEPEPLYM